MTIERELLLEDALRAMLRRDERNTCQHEDTHRGGSIWEICSICGARWADDEGGKPEWKDPQEWDQARVVLNWDKAPDRLEKALAVLYEAAPITVGFVCDTNLDPSGGLLQRVRDRARKARVWAEQDEEKTA